MKVVALREAKQQLSGCVVVLLMQNPRFWRMIEARRAEPTLGLAEVRKQLGMPSRRRRRR
jgi:hypothetical protein